MKIKVEDIFVSSDFREETPDIGELALSIQQNGLINPITLKKCGDKYEVLAGRRRFKALKDYLQFTELEVGIHCLFLDDANPLVVQFEENHRRKDFNPIELARLVKTIHKQKQDEVGPAIKGIGGGWGIKETARLLSSDPTFIKRLLKIADNEEIVQHCTTLTEALQTIDRFLNKQVIDTARKVRVNKALKEVEGLDIDDYISSFYNEDALSFLSTVESESIDFIHIDPPFAIDIDDVAGGATYEAYEDRPDEVLPLVSSVLKECFRVAKPNTFIVCWCANQYARWTQDELTKAGFSPANTLLYWVKVNSPSRVSDPTKRLGSAVEVAAYGWKGADAELTIKGRSNVFPFPTIRSERIHIAQKPETLVADILNIFSLPGALVLDCFGGSGSTLRACYLTRRRFVGCEIDENYYNSAVLETLKWHEKQSAA